MPTPRPTDAELAILTVLWRLGRSTVRQVHEELGDIRSNSSAYTTTLKLLQIMTGKRLVVRDESNRSHIYRATVSEDQTQKHLVRDLLDRAFAGSTHKLVMRTLSSKPASRAELKEIRRLLDDFNGG